MNAPRTWITMSSLLTLPVAALFSASHAKADPDTYTRLEGAAVCQALTADPSLATVANLIRVIGKDTDMTIEEAADVITTSVADWCPSNQYVLDRLAAVYAEPSQTYVAGGRVGGRIG